MCGLRLDADGEEVAGNSGVDLLAAHMSSAHPELGFKSKSKTCPQCPRSFRSFVELNRHLHRFHSPSDPLSSSAAAGETGDAMGIAVECLHCGQSFNSITDVKEHLSKEHSIKEKHSLHYGRGRGVSFLFPKLSHLKKITCNISFRRIQRPPPPPL